MGNAMKDSVVQSGDQKNNIIYITDQISNSVQAPTIAATTGPTANRLPRAVLDSIPGDFTAGFLRQIPQLNVTIDYKYYTQTGNLSPNALGGRYIDESTGLYLLLQENYLLLDVQEANTPFEKDNFHIEVMYVSGSTGAPAESPPDLVPMNFGPSRS